MATFRVHRLCLGLLALAWAGAAHAQSTDDAAAVARGQRAVSWIQGYACPRPGQPMNVQGVSTDAEIQRALNENWAFMQNGLNARQQALRQRDQVALELQSEGTQPSTRTQRSFAQLEAALSALDYRVATAEAQWALANYVLMSRAPADYDLLSGRPNPMAEYVPVVQALEGLTGQFGDPAQQVFRRFRECWINANDIYLDAAGPIIQQRVNQARTVEQLDVILSVAAVVPTNPELPGGRIIAEAQGKREFLVEEARLEEERRRARADAQALAQLQQRANATLQVATRYVRLLNAGSVGEASSLLAADVQLQSQDGGPARGRAAVTERMRSAQSRGQDVTMHAPTITSDYRVQARLTGGGRSGTMTFESSGGQITSISLRQGG